ncbi:hypothetical protein MRB53_036968 [Persea americana]|nr:hypothetical protein MRB53_036968 [Persea americana]
MNHCRGGGISRCLTGRMMRVLTALLLALAGSMRRMSAGMHEAHTRRVSNGFPSSAVPVFLILPWCEWFGVDSRVPSFPEKRLIDKKHCLFHNACHVAFDVRMLQPVVAAVHLPTFEQPQVELVTPSEMARLLRLPLPVMDGVTAARLQRSWSSSCIISPIFATSFPYLGIDEKSPAAAEAATSHHHLFPVACCATFVDRPEPSSCSSACGEALQGRQESRLKDRIRRQSAIRSQYHAEGRERPNLCGSSCLCRTTGMQLDEHEELRPSVHPFVVIVLLCCQQSITSQTLSPLTTCTT